MSIFGRNPPHLPVVLPGAGTGLYHREASQRSGGTSRTLLLPSLRSSQNRAAFSAPGSRQPIPMMAIGSGEAAVGARSTGAADRGSALRGAARGDRSGE